MIEGKARSFKAGTIMIPVSAQSVNQSEISTIIDQIAKNENIDIFGVSSGSSIKGIDLGSFNFSALEAVKPMLIVGNGVSSNEAGEVWHLLDTRLKHQCAANRYAPYKQPWISHPTMSSSWLMGNILPSIQPGFCI